VKRYYYSEDEESFDAGDWLDAETIGEVIAWASDELDLEPGMSIYIGTRQEVNPAAYVRAKDLLDAIPDRVCDDAGEDAAEMDWPTANPQQLAELDAGVKTLFVEWLKRNDLMPPFFRVVDVERFVIEE
jgi:hypothetical protein